MNGVLHAVFHMFMGWAAIAFMPMFLAFAFVFKKTKNVSVVILMHLLLGAPTDLLLAIGVIIEDPLVVPPCSRSCPGLPRSMALPHHRRGGAEAPSDRGPVSRWHPRWSTPNGQGRRQASRLRGAEER